MRRALVIFAVLVCLLAEPVSAARRKRSRPRRTPPRRELKVSPSEAIEARVQQEIRKADEILNQLDAVTIFDSPYVVSAVYYHDGFLSRYPEDKQDADPARRIISHISRLLTPQKKAQFLRLLHDLYDEQHPPPDRPSFLPPVQLNIPSKRRLRRTHPNAVDLFAPEGSPVRAASAGVVLSAENGWTESDPFSTSSHAGGNTVIMFDPATDRLYRYCHMQSVVVIPGSVLEPGQQIGFVGHTGLNASRDGHGRHLHFEVNQFRGEEIRPLSYLEVWSLLRQASTTECAANAHPCRPTFDRAFSPRTRAGR